MTGNQRFSNVMSKFPHQAREWRLRQASGQSPFAIIFSCVDSRVPPELVFDRGIGDLFVIRTAGHVIDNAALGSIEFGVEELHIPLIMVLGHQSCGAVAATIAALDQHTPTPDQINSLVAAITPAVEQARGQTGDRLDNAVRANIALTVERLRTVPLLGEAPEQQRVKLVGARYDLHTGGVEVTHM
jgi:carbonic anhydrase